MLRSGEPPHGRASGGIAAGLFKLGVGHGRLFVDAGTGFSALWLEDGDFERTSGSMSFHVAAGLELTETLALAARGDAHVMMHAEMAAAFAGAGIVWSP